MSQPSPSPTLPPTPSPTSSPTSPPHTTPVRRTSSSASSKPVIDKYTSIQHLLPAGYTYDLLLEHIQCVKTVCDTLHTILRERLSESTDADKYHATVTIQHNSGTVEHVDCTKYDMLGSVLDDAIVNELIPISMRDYMHVGLLNSANNAVHELSKIVRSYTIDMYNTQLLQSKASYRLCRVSKLNIHIVDTTINQPVKQLTKLVQSDCNLANVQQYVTQWLAQFCPNESLTTEYFRAFTTKAGHMRSKAKITDPQQTLLDHKFNQANAVFLVHITNRRGVPADKTDTVNLAVELHNSDVVYLEKLSRGTTVAQIKQLIRQYLNVFENTSQTYVIYQNETLDDDGTLGDYDISTGTCLQVLQVVEQYDHAYTLYNKKHRNNYIKLTDNAAKLVLELIAYVKALPHVYRLRDMMTEELQRLLLDGRALLSRLYEKVKLGLILGHNIHGHSWITDERIVVDNTINLISPLKKRLKVYAGTATIQLGVKLVEKTDVILKHKHIAKPRRLHTFSFTSSDHHGALPKPLLEPSRAVECVNLISPMSDQQLPVIASSNVAVGNSQQEKENNVNS